MAIDIVDLPIKVMIFNSYVNVFPEGTNGFGLFWHFLRILRKVWRSAVKATPAETIGADTELGKSLLSKMEVSWNRGTPTAGWSSSGKIPSINGW